MWDDQLRVVAATCKAVAYDRRGFGAARAEPEYHSPVADPIAAVDAVAHGEPAILVGYS